MLINQQQLQVPDHSTMALVAHRPQNSQFFRGRGFMHSRFPQRNFSPRPANGFSTPRLAFQQYNRGPPQYHRRPSQGYSPFNQQYNHGPAAPNQGNFPNKQQNSTSLQQGSNPLSGSRASCQICGKTSHSAIDCYHRMDYAFQGRNPPT
jgi:hypothetical protein